MTDGTPLSFANLNHADKEVMHDFNNLLIRTEAGTPKAILANAITVLRFHDEWAGVLAFDEFSLKATIKKRTPWGGKAGDQWTDHDDILCSDWLQRNTGILISPKTTADATQAVAKENSYHPVRDYLKSLVWEKKERIDTWLATYLGVANTPFSRAVGTRWLVSAVARIMQPGCKVDHVLLLEGPQGIRKSTGIRTLTGDEWFGDHNSDLGGKDSRIELSGKWVVEMQELASVKRTQLESVKAFITAQTDRFRPPYGRRAVDVPRQCVFAGTSNAATPFSDETGSRRFWPVRCGDIDIEGIARDRDQLWAEAYDRYKVHPVWWLDTSELVDAASSEQDERYQPGVWDEIIREWLDDPQQRHSTDGGAQLPVTPFDSNQERVTITDVLIHAIGKDQERLTDSDSKAVARCLRHFGWLYRQDRSRGVTRGKRFYWRPERKTGEGE